MGNSHWSTGIQRGGERNTNRMREDAERDHKAASCMNNKDFSHPQLARLLPPIRSMAQAARASRQLQYK
eukprot:763940-Hanusia_phi.AAC.19